MTHDGKAAEAPEEANRDAGRVEAPDTPPGARARLGRIGLSARLLLIVTLGILPLFGLAVAQGMGSRDAARAAALAEARRLTTAVAVAQEGLLERARDVALALVAVPEVRADRGGRCPAVLASLTAEYPYIGNLAVTDAAGTVVCSAVPLSGTVSVADRDYFRRAVAMRSVAVGEYQVGQITRKPLVGLALPILDAEGAVGDVVLVGLDLDTLGDIAGATTLPEGAAITLVDRNGTILARRPAADAWVGTSVPETPLREALLAGGEGTIETLGVDGVLRLYAHRPVGADVSAGFGLAVGFEAAHLYAGVDEQLALSLAWLVLVLVAAYAIVIIGARTMIMRPVATLLATTRQLAAGVFASRTGLAERSGELGQLAQAVDEMASSVERRVMARTDELRSALAELDDLYNRAPVGYHSLDANGAFARINDTELAWLGYAREEVIGRQVTDFMPPAGVETFRANFGRLRDRGSISGVEIDLVRRDGTILPIEVTATAIHDEAGAFVGTRSMVADIAERRRAREALRAALAEATELYENAPAGYYSRDRDSLITRMNATLLRWLGYERDEVVGRLHAIDLYTSEGAGRLREVVARLGAEAHLPDVELEMRRKDGSALPAQGSIEVVRDEAGTVNEVRVSVIDVTERTAAQDELERTRAELERFFDLSVDVFVVTGQNGRFERINAALARLLGYAPEVILSRPWDAFVHPDDRERSAAEFAREVELGHRTIGFDNRYVSADGSVHWMEWNAQFDASSGVVYGIARDVTDRRRIAAALESARQEAEQASRAKSEFLSRISHELRTPLNSILGFAQLLGMDHLDEEQRESQEQILRSGRHLLDLINEVLDISRIESGQLAISPEPVNVHDAVGDAVAIIGPLAAAQAIPLRVEEIAPDLHVLADHQRLKQVLLNLLSNAVKYNRPGGTVGVACRSAGAAVLRIAVSDEGSGITPAQEARLFAPFDRLGAEAGSAEGTGLGLALSKALAEAMGGALGLESTPGVGSTFWVELPVATPPAGEPAGRPPAASAAPMREGVAGTVLYVEDNVANFRLLERTLALRVGVRLVPAMLGRLALDLAREIRPNLVLLDLHLPDMDGDEILLRLRADPATRDIPVVILSADATPSQVARLLADGARAYLTKPLDLVELLALVDDVLAPGKQG